MGKNRTFSICLSDLPKDRMFKHQNGKVYIDLSSYDNDQPDQFGHDFSISVPLTKEEVERKKSGEEIKRIYVGNGRIWPDKNQPINEEDADDLPF